MAMHLEELSEGKIRSTNVQSEQDKRGNKALEGEMSCFLWL